MCDLVPFPSSATWALGLMWPNGDHPHQLLGLGWGCWDVWASRSSLLMASYQRTPKQCCVVIMKSITGQA